MSTSPKSLCCDDSIKIYTSLLQQNEHIVSQTLSLHDPASLQRMQVPCRAFDCEHLQCFDYSVIRLLNKSNERAFFKCSVCNETRNPDKIYVDFVTVCLLRLYACSDSFKLYRDGTLRPSGPISPVYEGMEINTVFDIKKLCDYPGFQSNPIQLRQLNYTSVFDINDYINKSGSAALFKLITKGCKKLSSKGTELTAGIDKLRPFNSNTWLGLQHSFQTLPSVGDKKGASLVKELREEYDRLSLNHLNNITSGPLNAEDNKAQMPCGSVYEIKKVEDIMVDLCGDDDDDEETPPAKTFVKTALDAPLSSSLSATVVAISLPSSAAPLSTLTSLVALAPSSSSGHFNVVQTAHAVHSTSSGTSSNRQFGFPVASTGHNSANHQGSATVRAPGTAPLSNAHLNNPHFLHHDLNQSVVRPADRQRKTSRTSDLPPGQFTGAVTGRGHFTPQNNFNVPHPLRRENGTYPDPARGRNISQADSGFSAFTSTSTAPSSSSTSSSMSEHLSSTSNFYTGNGHLNPNTSSNQANSTVRPSSPMVGMTAGPTASLIKPSRKSLTGANSPWGASTAVVCRGEVGQSMQRRPPRVQSSVEMMPSNVPSKAPMESHIADRIAAFNRWLLAGSGKKCTRSTQTECMDGSDLLDTISQSSVVERSISSRPSVQSSSSAAVPLIVPTYTPLETPSTPSAIGGGGTENTTLYWLDPTGILKGDQGPSIQPTPSGTVLGNNIDDDGDVTMDINDEMDDDMQATLCAEIDQMDSEALGNADDGVVMGRIETDSWRHITNNFDGYEVNSNYSTSDCDSSVEKEIPDQIENQNRDDDMSNISISNFDRNTNATASSCDDSLSVQPAADPMIMRNSESNVETNTVNSSVYSAHEEGRRDLGYSSRAICSDSSSSRDDVTPDLVNSSTQMSSTDDAASSDNIDGVDVWTIRLFNGVSASALTPITATPATVITAAATTVAPADAISAEDGLAASADPGPGSTATATVTVTVTAGVATASEDNDLAVAVTVTAAGTVSSGGAILGSAFDFGNASSEKTMEYFTKGTPNDSGDTTESEDDMIDGRGRSTRKSKPPRVPTTVPEASEDSAVVVGRGDSAGIAVEDDQSDAMRRDVIAAVWAEIETETEPEEDQLDSQASSSWQPTGSATQSYVNITGPVTGSVSLGNMAASTSAAATAYTRFPFTTSAASSAVDGTTAGRAESTTHVPDAPTDSTPEEPPRSDATAMTMSDPSTSSAIQDQVQVPSQGQISGTANGTSGGRDIPLQPCSQTDTTAEHSLTADATRTMSSAVRTAPPSAFNERIYNSSGRFNTTSTMPSVPTNGFRRKTPLDVSSSSAENINRDRGAAQLPGDTTSPPSSASASSIVIPTVTVTADAASVSELPPTAANLSLRQLLPPIAALHIPSESMLQPSLPTLTTSTLIPSTSTHTSTSTSLATPASSVSAATSLPTVQPAVTVPPVVSVAPLLIPAQLTSHMGAAPRREVVQGAAMTDVSTDPPAATIPRRKSAAASPRIPEVQDPTAVTGVTQRTALVVSASSATHPATLDPDALDSPLVEVSSTSSSSSSGAPPQGEEQLFSSNNYGFYDGNADCSEQGSAANANVPHSTVQRVESASEAERFDPCKNSYHIEQERVPELQPTEILGKKKKRKTTPEGLPIWAYRLAKVTQCMDLQTVIEGNAAYTNYKLTKKRIEQWNRVVAWLTKEGHYATPPAESTAEIEPGAVSSSSFSATSVSAIEAPAPSRPAVHATTVGDWMCGRCRRVIDFTKRVCPECNVARPLEATARTTDILRRCQSCSIAPSSLPCAACAAMVPAIRAAFRPMTAIPKAGKERRSALAHEKPPYLEAELRAAGPDKRPLPPDGPNGVPSDQDNRNKAKNSAKKATTGKETAMHTATLKAAPAPGATPVRKATTQLPLEKTKKAKTVATPPSSSSSLASSAHTTSAATASSTVTSSAPSASSQAAKADAQRSSTTTTGAAAAVSMAKAAVQGPSSSASDFYIDLTLDDDDDDDVDDFGRTKQTTLPAVRGTKASSTVQDSSAKRKHSTAFGGTEDPSHSGDTAGSKKKANATSMVTIKILSQSKTKLPTPPGTLYPSSTNSNTASMGPPRPPPTPYPNPPSSSVANSYSSAHSGYKTAYAPFVGQNSQPNSSHNAVQPRPIAPDKRPGPVAPQGEKVRPTRPMTKPLPANRAQSGSDPQDSFSALCVNDFSCP